MYTNCKTKCTVTTSIYYENHMSPKHQYFMNYDCYNDSYSNKNDDSDNNFHIIHFFSQPKKFGEFFSSHKVTLHPLVFQEKNKISKFGYSWFSLFIVYRIAMQM